MNRYPVSMIPYANMAPFRQLDPPAGMTFVEQTPRQSAAALAEGSVVAACVPVGALPLLGDRVRPIGSYGIAASGPVGSVFLFSNRPFEQMGRETDIFLTDHSASSVRLLYLLLGELHGYANVPARVEDRDAADGELVIGDRALVEVHSTRFDHVTDLAERWCSQMQLPFVFARWVVRSDAPGSVAAGLEEWFGEFGRRKGELIQRCVPQEARRLGLAEEQIAAYLKIIRWTLGPREQTAMKRFLSSWATHGREPVFARRADTARRDP